MGMYGEGMNPFTQMLGNSGSNISQSQFSQLSQIFNSPFNQNNPRNYGSGGFGNTSQMQEFQIPQNKNISPSVSSSITGGTLSTTSGESSSPKKKGKIPSENDRAEKQKAKGRESAKKCRERKKQYVKGLEEKVF